MTSSQNIIRLPKPELFSFTECLHFLDRGYDDCLYSVEEGRVVKPLRIDGREVLFQVTEEENALAVEILRGDPSKGLLGPTARYVTEWFDLERDLRPFYKLLDRHELLSGCTGTYSGLRLMGIPDLFEALCWCVIGQQINLTFAYRLKRKLVETYGTSLEHSSARHYLFPEPEVLAGLTVDDLRDLQFSRQKSEYIIGIANEVAAGTITKKQLADLGDSGPMLKRLLRIRGVGEWTANYVLMKSLRRPDCITHGDTGLQSAVSSLLELDRKPTREEVESLFRPFRGWESYLVIYLWRTLG